MMEDTNQQLTDEQVTARMEELTAQQQALGAQIDQIRDQRRAIVAEIKRLHAAQRIRRFARENPDIGEQLRRDAEAPGAVVEVTGAEVIQAMAAATKK